MSILRTQNTNEKSTSEVSNMTQQIGVIGLAVMGKNLAWNIESRGYSVSGLKCQVKKLI